MQDESIDPFAGGERIVTKSFKFGAIGDVLTGTYVSKELKPALTGSGNAWVYTVIGISGTYHWAERTKDKHGNVMTIVDDEPSTVKPGDIILLHGKETTKRPNDLDVLFAGIQFGDRVAIKFREAKPSSNPNFSPTKLYDTRRINNLIPEIPAEALPFLAPQAAEEVAKDLPF